MRLRKGLPKGFGRSLILGLLVLIFYGTAVLSYCQFQAEPSEAIFLSGEYLSAAQGEEILKSMEKAEEKSAVCFYWDGGITTLRDPDYGRSAQVMAGALVGEGRLYDWRLTGLGKTDREGCVIDIDTAEKLFGTKKAEGRSLIMNEKKYQVRQVLPWKQRMILSRPQNKEILCSRVFFKGSGVLGEKTSDQFLMAYGLSGTALDTGFLKGAAGFFLMLFPAAVFLFLFKKAYREAKKYKGKEAGFWIWRGACFILVAFVLGFLWNKIEIPKDWIPSVWSDFQFWQDKFKEAGENFRMFLMMPKTVLQAENISSCIRTVFFSVSALIFSFMMKISN